MSTIRRSLAYSFLARYANMTISFVAIVIISRLLTPEEIGIFSVSMAIVGLAHTLRQFGVSTYLVQEQDLTLDRIRTAFGLAFVIAWGIGAIMVISSGLIAAFYREEGVRDVLLILALNFLLVPFGAPSLALLQRAMRFADISKIQIAATVVQTLVTIALIVWGQSYLSLAIGSVVGLVTTTLMLIALRAPHILILPSLKEWRHILRFCFPTVGGHLVSEMGVIMPDLAMGRLLGFGPVAFYSRALGLTRLFSEGVLQAVWPVALSVFSDAKRKNGDVAAGYILGTKLLAGLAMPFYAVMGILAYPMVLVLYGDQWRESVPLLQVLCVAYLIFAPWALSGELLYAMGRAREALIKEIIIQGVRIVLVIAASTHSAMAVAIAQVAVMIVSVIVVQYFIKRVIGVSFRSMLMAAGHGALVTLVTVLPAIAALLWAGEDLGRWYQAFPAALLGAAIAWLAAVYLVHHPIRGEIGRLMPPVVARHLATRRL